MAHQEEVVMGAGGVPKGSKTSDYYRTFNIPERFENPEWFEGYERKTPHPLYRTTAQDYGLKPNVHTMPNHFHGRSQSYSNHLGVCGMPRNTGANCAKTTSRV